jgi:large-conductance mechanosensitive channel
MNTLQSEIFSFIIITFVVILLAFFTQKLQSKDPKEQYLQKSQHLLSL